MQNTKLSLINTVVMKGIRSPKARPAAINAIGDIPIVLERFGDDVHIRLTGTVDELMDMRDKSARKRKLAKFILTHSDWGSNMPSDYWNNALGLMHRFYVGPYEIPESWLKQIIMDRVEPPRELPIDARSLTVLMATIECSKCYETDEFYQAQLFRGMNSINGLSFDQGSHDRRRIEIMRTIQAGLIERRGKTRYLHRLTAKGRKLTSRIKRDFMSTLKYHSTHSVEHQGLFEILGGKITDEQEEYMNTYRVSY